MCGGGVFRDSVTLVSGATGTGKTLMSTEFIAGGVAAGDRCMIFGFEESRDQLFRNARGWGADFEDMEDAGPAARSLANYPETASIEDHLVAIKDAVNDFGPQRIAIDSLSALERVAHRPRIPRVRHRPDQLHQAPEHLRAPDRRRRGACSVASRSPSRTSRR